MEVEFIVDVAATMAPWRETVAELHHLLEGMGADYELELEEPVDALGKQVVSQIQLIDGISRTLTCPVVHL